MKKTLFIALAFIAGGSFCYGQQALPNDPEVRTGKLDNGMTYYIRHNEKPAQRAEFYLATNAGAIQEGEGQDGLAHFLEHMCFNGLKNLPGKQMLEYLQHIGAEFGRNINASTGVEQTQYMLNNIPVIREGIIDTCLLVMHDYSHFVLNEPAEIDAERGVILEEKRTRNTASWRMFEKSLKYYYGESSKYAGCNVIGSEETLKTFKPETIVDFYSTWYRPDLQAIIVVGDIDVDKIQEKIVKLFSDIPAPVNPREKVMPAVEFNEKPVVGILTDPENTSTNLEIVFKLGEPLSKEMNGTDAGFTTRLLKRIVSGVLNERLEDISAKPDSPFLGAGVGIFDLTRTCEAFDASLTCENAKVIEATGTLYTEIEKARRYGFSDDELERVKQDIIKSAQDRASAAESRKNPEFISPLINNFFRGISYLTPETELMLTNAICSQVSAELVNQVLPQILGGEHMVVLYSGVDQPGQVHPTEEQLLSVIEGVKASEIKPNEVEAIDKDFMAGRTLKAGKVKKTATGLYGSTVWKFKNGLTVVVLPTEYKKDQVLIDLSRMGGSSLFPDEAMATFDRNIMTLFNSNRGVAGFSKTTVGKMLAGKTVSIAPYINMATNGVSGSCTPEDIETALQLVNLYFTAQRFDQDEWNLTMTQLNSVVANMVSTPDYAFSDHLYKDLYSDSPRLKMISPESIANASLETYEKYSSQIFDGVSGATMFIVGNVNPETIKPLVEKYCGSIAKGAKAGKWNLAGIPEYIRGTKSDVFETTMTTPKVTVFQFYNSAVKYSMQKEVNLDAASFILDMIYTQTLREEEGGTYGASAVISISSWPRSEAMVQIAFDTNTAQQEKLRELAISGIKGLAADGPTEEQLTRAIENARKNVPEKQITNGYWKNALIYRTMTGGDFDKEYTEAVANISAEGIKAALNEILSSGNFLEVVMTPKE